MTHLIDLIMDLSAIGRPSDTPEVYLTISPRRFVTVRLDVAGIMGISGSMRYEFGSANEKYDMCIAQLGLIRDCIAREEKENGKK